VASEKRYRAERLLGRGGMGEVYEAFDTKLGRVVALKVIVASRLGDEMTAKRFRREVRAMAAVNHPNVVRLFDFSERGSRVFFTMEYVDGRTVAELVAEGPVDPRTAVAIVAGAAEGLHAVHRAGVVHRDIKPANIMVAADGTAKLMDFGLVKDADVEATRLTGTGQLVGTLAYLPPERLRHEDVDGRSDVFQLGLVAYELLTGRNPNTYEVMAALSAGDEPLRFVGPGVDEVLDGVVLQALALDPNRRFQTAAEFAGALREWLAGGGTAPKRVAATKTERARWGLSRTVRLVVAAGLLGLSVVLGWSVVGKGRPAAAGIHDFAVTAVGTRSAVVEWRSDRRFDAPTLVVRRHGTDEPLQVRCPVVQVVQTTSAAERGTMPFAHRVVVVGLRPDTAHEVALRRPDGDVTVVVAAKTLRDGTFTPRRTLSLTAAGELEVTVESAIPFTMVADPRPQDVVPPDEPGRHDYRDRRIYRFSLRRLAAAGRLRATLTSIDQVEATWDLVPAEVLSAEFADAFEDFRRTHAAGAFLRPFDGVVGERRFWERATSALVEQASWYRRLRRFFPGLPSLLGTPLADGDVRLALAASLAPLEAIEAAARSHGVVDTHPWQGFVGEQVRPCPVLRPPFTETVTGRTTAFVWSDGRSESFRLVADTRHPSWTTVGQDAAEATAELTSLLLLGARTLYVELVVRTGAQGVVPVVDVQGCPVPMPLEHGVGRVRLPDRFMQAGPVRAVVRCYAGPTATAAAVTVESLGLVIE